MIYDITCHIYYDILKEKGREREMAQQFSKMQKHLIKVLSTMDIKEENKVLISLELTEDKQIYTFLKWLKERLPEHKKNTASEKFFAKYQ